MRMEVCEGEPNEKRSHTNPNDRRSHTDRKRAQRPADIKSAKREEIDALCTG
ncbi:MAG TPA: hypothetical protein VK211_29085 [Kamptonema sp.]|nr:hypothetical protein [Kamptonema sp.]